MRKFILSLIVVALVGVSGAEARHHGRLRERVHNGLHGLRERTANVLHALVHPAETVKAVRERRGCR